MSRWAFIGAVFSLAAALPSSAHAQFEPEAPSKSSTSIADSNVGFDGQFSTSVSIDLPPARGDLNVPLSITHNGSREIDAVGVGWTIPLFTITRSTSLSQRKPFYGGTRDGTEPFSDERIFLDMGGSSMMLRLVGSDGEGKRYRPLIAGEYMSASWFSSGGLSWWVVRDSAARTYVFDQVGVGTVGDADNDRWFLTSIKDASGMNRVNLEYGSYVYERPFGVLDGIIHPTPSPFIEMRLQNVRYSYPESGSCPKYRIELKYAETASGLISLFFTNAWPSFGQHILSELNVWSHDGLACSEATANRLRSYRFSYTNAADTGLPNLTAVDMLGKGATDINAGVPVARYAYGNALPSDGKLHFLMQPTTYRPDDALVADFNVSTNTRATEGQQLADLNGDGRPDLYYSKDDHFYWHRNLPVSTSSTDNSFGEREEIELGGLGVDWNGDGRPDRITPMLRDDLGHYYWQVFLNTPDPVDPQEIVWKEARVNVTRLHDTIKPGDSGPFFEISSSLPAAPPMQNSDEHTCKSYSQAPDGTWRLQDTPCDQLDARTRQWGWNAKWDLRDVNGDGFPDLVYYRKGVETDQCSKCPNTVLHEENIPAECRQGCMARLDLESANEIGVFYHTGLNMSVIGAHDGANQFGEDPVILYDGSATDTPGFAACGLDRATTDGTSYSWQQCALQDVNGDGLADYVSESSAPVVGVPASAVTRRVALLGSGTPKLFPSHGQDWPTTKPSFQAHVAMPLPGRINLQSFKFVVFCNANVEDWQTEQYSGLVDMTGDGRPDYVYYGDDQHEFDGTLLSMPAGDDLNVYWRVRVNTGTGFGPPHRIVVPRSMTFGLSRTKHHCNEGTKEETVVIALKDLDGDGRPDLINSTGSALQVAKIVGSGAIPGIPDAGKVVRIDNGYGGTVVVGYSSAKMDASSLHQIPGPEIVVTSVTRIPTHGLSLGVAELPTVYAYGDARYEYDPFMHGWGFSGYRRRVERRASNQSQSPPTYAKISERALRSDFPGDRFSQYALLGSTRRIIYFDDGVGTDQLLGRDIYSEFSLPFQRGADEQEMAIITQSDAVFTGTEECGDVPDPYDFNFGDLFTGREAQFCRTTGITYQKASAKWRGSSPLLSSTAYVQSSTVVSEVDCFGRTLSKAHINDTSRGDDNVCEWTTYAGTTCKDFAIAAGTVLTARATVRLTPDCKDNRTFLTGGRYEYDEKPLGDVGLGRLTTSYKEIYNTSFPSSPILNFKAKTSTYDRLGNVTTATDYDGGANSRSTTYQDFDPFGIAARRVTVTATNAVAQVSRTTLDSVSMQVTAMTDANGVTSRTSYDELCRPIRETVQDGANPEYVVSSTEYHGDRLGSDEPQTPFFSGRRTSLTVYHAFTPVDSPPLANEATTTISYLDEYGRERFTEERLGTDYGSQSLIHNYQTYDALGRTSFVADAFPLSELARPYGTTTTYYDDGQVACNIRAPMGSASTTPDDAGDNFPTCTARTYEGLQSVTRRRGPNELKSTGAQAGAYVETVSSATGWVLSLARVQNGNRYESQSFAYDHLGHLVALNRNRSVVPSGGPVVTWTFTNDSTGSILERREPGLAPVAQAFNGWGAITKTSWNDAQGVAHAIESSFDGLGRETQRRVLLGGLQDSTVDVTTMSYDLASSEQIGFGAAHLVGRLSNTTRGRPSSADTERVFFSYDLMGREKDTARINRLDAARRVFHELRTNGPSGRVQSMEYKLPDSPETGEGAFYTYDTGGRMREVEWLDTAGAESLWRADDVSARGEYRHIQLGSGASETFDFAAQGRRLPTSYELKFGNSASPSGVGYHRITYDSYDSQGRVLQTKEHLKKQFQGETVTTSNYDYDVANRLARARKVQSSGGVSTQQMDETYLFDPLGNMTTRRNNTSHMENRYVGDTADPDRLCRSVMVVEGAPTPPGTCSQIYDERGALTIATTSTSSQLRVLYNAGGAVQSLEIPGGSHMDFGYDASGGITSVVSSALGPDKRRDWRYGPNIEEQLIANENVIAIDRQVSAISGTVATIRRRADGGRVVLYRHGDNKLLQDFTDQTRSLAQHLEFNPFGMPLVSDPSVGTDRYTKYQWDGGDALRPFGISLLGARLYDPSAGRFLERDPIISPRSSSQVNPYAYAHGDPINKADSSGEDPVLDEWMAYTQLNALPGLIEDSPIGTAIRGGQHAADLLSGAGRVLGNAAKDMYFGAVTDAYVFTAEVFGDEAATEYVREKGERMIDGAISTYTDAGGGWLGTFAVINSANPVNMVVAGAYQFSAAIDRGDYDAAGGSLAVMGLGVAATVGVATGVESWLAGMEPAGAAAAVNRIGGSSVENLMLKPGEMKLRPPGISVLLDTDAVGAAGQMRAAFPDASRLLESTKVVGQSTVSRIRDAGFEVINNPTSKFPNHGRIVHPEGAAGFNPTNLDKLSRAFEDVDVP
jgi:RHS repeat-associated protein